MVLNLLTRRADSLVAVRTFSAVELFNVKKFESSFQATSVAKLTHQNTNGEDVVDMVYAVETPEVILISDRGTLFSCDVKNGGRTR
jgi:hypothetical protein